jgi:hypothetical protein
MSARAAMSFVLGSLALALASPAHAHPEIDRALALVDEVDFDGAIAAFARAESGTDLTLDDLATLFAHRAAVYQALGDSAASDRDLSRLAAVRPNYVFGPWAPPSLREAFERSRGSRPFGLDVSAHAAAGRVEIDVEVAGDPGDLVRAVRIFVRREGESDWSELAAGETSAEGNEIDYYVEAVGPGGAVVANAGSAAAPRRIRGEAIAIVEPVDDDDGSLVLWLIAGGAGLAVVAVVTIVAIAVASSGSDQTTFGPPMLRLP